MNTFPLTSATKPESIVTVYVCTTCADVSPPAMLTLTMLLPLLTLTSVDTADTVTALPLLDGVSTRLPLLPFVTASLNVRTMSVLSETPLSPLLGDWLTSTGTTLSDTVNEYVAAPIPANAFWLLESSLTKPDPTVTVKTCPTSVGFRLAVGFTVTVLPLTVTCVASLARMTTSPVAALSVMIAPAPAPATTSSLNTSTMLLFTPTLLAPLVGDRLTIVGATASTTVNLYVLPLSPAQETPLASVRAPLPTVTVYTCSMIADVRLLPGWMVTMLDELMSVLLAATATVSALPLLAGVSTTLPLPSCMGSLNVSTMSLVSATSEAPCTGEKAVAVGATLSATPNVSVSPRYSFLTVAASVITPFSTVTT